jgi:hypothetical protein
MARRGRAGRLTLVTLETEAPAHAWVSGTLFITVAARDPAAVLIDLHEVQ